MPLNSSTRTGSAMPSSISPFHLGSMALIRLSNGGCVAINELKPLPAKNMCRASIAFGERIVPCSE